MSLGVALVIALGCAAAGHVVGDPSAADAARRARHGRPRGLPWPPRARVGASRSGVEFDELGHAFNLMASQLEHTEDTRRRLLSDLAHELRTPIATLTIYCEGLRDGVTEWNADTERVFTEQTERLARLGC